MDVHICGWCKAQFNDFVSFFEHKNSCHPSPEKIVGNDHDSIPHGHHVVSSTPASLLSQSQSGASDERRGDRNLMNKLLGYVAKSATSNPHVQSLLPYLHQNQVTYVVQSDDHSAFEGNIEVPRQELPEQIPHTNCEVQELMTLQQAHNHPSTDLQTVVASTRTCQALPETPAGTSKEFIRIDALHNQSTNNSEESVNVNTAAESIQGKEYGNNDIRALRNACINHDQIEIVAASSPCGSEMENLEILSSSKREENASINKIPRLEIEPEKLTKNDLETTNVEDKSVDGMQELDPILIYYNGRWEKREEDSPRKSQLSRQTNDGSGEITQTISVQFDPDKGGNDKYSDKKTAKKVGKVEKKKEGQRKRRYICKYEESCTFESPYLKDLARHLRTHTGDKPFSCSFCDKRFSRRDKLKMHENAHKGIKPYICSMCPYRSVDSTSVKKHMQVHTDERNYRCQLCSYGGRTWSQLKVHLRKHTGDMPFNCPYCPSKFKIKSDLSRHVRIHTGEKPFQCKFCSFSCTTQGNLRSHERTHHAADRKFMCNVCNFTTSSKRAQFEHNKTHWDIDPALVCSICQYISSSTQSLKNHLATHSASLTCSQCDFKGSSTEDLIKHRQETGHVKKKRPIKSAKQSTGKEKKYDRNYRCNICKEAFVRKDSLKSHLNLHMERSRQAETQKEASVDTNDQCVPSLPEAALMPGTKEVLTKSPENKKFHITVQGDTVYLSRNPGSLNLGSSARSVQICSSTAVPSASVIHDQLSQSSVRNPNNSQKLSNKPEQIYENASNNHLSFERSENLRDKTGVIPQENLGNNGRDNLQTSLPTNTIIYQNIVGATEASSVRLSSTAPTPVIMNLHGNTEPRLHIIQTLPVMQLPNGQLVSWPLQTLNPVIQTDYSKAVDPSLLSQVQNKENSRSAEILLTSKISEEGQKENFQDQSALGIGQNVISYSAVSQNVISIDALGQNVIGQSLLNPHMINQGIIGQNYLEENSVSHSETVHNIVGQDAIDPGAVGHGVTGQSAIGQSVQSAINLSVVDQNVVVQSALGQNTLGQNTLGQTLSKLGHDHTNVIIQNPASQISQIINKATDHTDLSQGQPSWSSIPPTTFDQSLISHEAESQSALGHKVRGHKAVISHRTVSPILVSSAPICVSSVIHPNQGKLNSNSDQVASSQAVSTPPKERGIGDKYVHLLADTERQESIVEESTDVSVIPVIDIALTRTDLPTVTSLIPVSGISVPLADDQVFSLPTYHPATEQGVEVTENLISVASNPPSKIPHFSHAEAVQLPTTNQYITPSLINQPSVVTLSSVPHLLPSNDQEDLNSHLDLQSIERDASTPGCELPELEPLTSAHRMVVITTQ